MDLNDLKMEEVRHFLLFQKRDSVDETNTLPYLLELLTIAESGEFSYEIIKHLMTLPEQDLLACLSALKEAELLYERRIFPQSVYVFKHSLTRETVYNTLLHKRKIEIHKGIGTTLVSDWQGIPVKAAREMCPALVWSATRTLFSPIGSISDESPSNVWQQLQFVSVVTDKIDYI